MENLTNDTPSKKGFWTPPSYGASSPLRYQCSVLPVQKSTPEQTRNSFGGVREFSGECVLWYVFLPPYVLHPTLSRPRERGNRALAIVLYPRPFLRLQYAIQNSVFEASKLVSTKALLLQHYYRHQGFWIFFFVSRCPSSVDGQGLCNLSVLRGDALPDVNLGGQPQHAHCP